MAENLDYTTESGSVCYDNDPANCEIYGRLYNWATAMALPSSCNSSDCASQVQAEHQGICPSGWHLPSDDEWQILVYFVGGSTAGKKLKTASGWSSNGNGTDGYGFSALPGGIYANGGGFYYAGDRGHWWSASERASEWAYYWGIYYSREDTNHSYYNKDNESLSVRCLQATPPITGTFTDSRDGKTYKWVEIDRQTWMAENLNYETESGSKCRDNDQANCEIYGRLYDWATAMDLPSSCNSSSCKDQVSSYRHQGICPSGWYLPSESEWKVLSDRGGDGRMLRASNWADYYNGNGIDAYGFAALSGGSVWWSPNGSDNYTATRVEMNVNLTNYTPDGKSTGHSVRCLRQ
jgi:uncharacterized protein (TIGR02145 family)